MEKRRALRRKIKTSIGTTFAEMLMTVLILLMVSSVVAVGVPSAVNAYSKVVDAANAQMLLSTTVTQLRRELSLAKKVSLNGNVVNTYVNGDNGFETKLECGTDGITRTWTESGIAPQLLVSKEAATFEMRASFSNITYADGIFTVNGLKINKTNYNNPLASINKLEIRAVNSPVIAA